MGRHGGARLHTFDMVEHDPHVLKVASYLYTLDEVDSATRSNLEHFEDEDLVGVRTLTKK